MRGGTQLKPRVWVVEAFQSPRPLRGGTVLITHRHGDHLFQSTRPLRGGTACVQRLSPRRVISIHPPLAGRDEIESDTDCIG